MPRWTLATPVWDYQLTAAETIVGLGKGSAAYPYILRRFNKSMAEDNLNDIFSNAFLVSALGDARGQEISTIKPANAN